MADSLCGPSNALQNFQKHNGVDRTLQQDRLVSRQSPSQGFRSSPGPNAGVLDPEFHAFQTGLPLESHAFPHHHTPQNLQAPGSSPWASDFQRQQSSSSPSGILQPQYGPAQAHVPGGWHNEFKQFQGMSQNQTATPPRQAFSPTQNMGYVGGMGMQQPYLSGGALMSGGLPSQVSNLQQQNQHQEEIFDEDAFAAAFDEVLQEATESAQKEPLQAEVQGQDLQAEVQIQPEVEVSEIQEEPIPISMQKALDTPIGADTIHDPKDKTYPQPAEDSNALAKTAGDLFAAVGGANNKFANSEFMLLMRQLRDHEVKVEGTDLVNTNSEPKPQDQSQSDIQMQT